MGTFTFIDKIRNKIKNKGQDNTFNIHKKTKIVGCIIYVKGNNNTLTIQENVTLRNSTIEIIGKNCSVEIGNHTMIGDGCYLSCKESTQLTIKENCGLSRNVKIMTSDGHPIFHNNQLINQAQNVTIEKNVWIADSVTILKGINIGEGSVIGIGSVVTKSSPKNSILAGNPAKVVKENIVWKPC